MTTLLTPQSITSVFRMFCISLMFVPQIGFAMTTPIFTLNPPSSAPSNTLVRYFPLGPAGSNAAGTSNNSVRQPMPIAGTFSRLYAYFPNPLTTGQQYVLDLFVNGVGTDLKVTITDRGTMEADLVNRVSVSAGDEVSLRLTPSGTPTSQSTGIQVGLVFEAAVFGESLILNNFSSASTTATVYGPFGYSDSGSATENIESNVFPTNGTIDRFNLLMSAAPGTGVTRTFTLMQNGVATALGCSISDSTTSCSDTSNSVTAVAGDTFSIRSEVSGGTAAAANAKMSTRFVPAIPGESVTLAAAGTPSPTGLRYIGPAMYSSNSQIEALSVALSPIKFDWKKLHVKLNVAPSAGRSRAVTARVNYATTTFSATVSDTSTTATNTTDVLSVQSGSFFNWVTDPSGSPTSPGRVRISAVAYIEPPSTFIRYGTMLLNYGRLIIN